jgi:hypothetical protein
MFYKFWTGSARTPRSNAATGVADGELLKLGDDLRFTGQSLVNLFALGNSYWDELRVSQAPGGFHGACTRLFLLSAEAATKPVEHDLHERAQTVHAQGYMPDCSLAHIDDILHHYHSLPGQPTTSRCYPQLAGPGT